MQQLQQLQQKQQLQQHPFTGSGDNVHAGLLGDVHQYGGLPVQPDCGVLHDAAAAGAGEPGHAVQDGRLGVRVVQDEVVRVAVATNRVCFLNIFFCNLHSV